MRQENLEPKVSVFILTYNHEKYIRACLDSVLAQHYSNLEIVVGDDASTDNTQNILKDYAQEYPELFKLSLNKENLGITKNCNKILSLCTGKYICMLGGDDVLFPDKIKIQAQYLENNPDCVLCYHNAEIFFSEEPEKEAHLYYDSINPYGTIEELFCQIPFFICPVSTAIRRSAVPRNGFDERLPVISDRLFFIRVALKGSTHYIDQVLMRYRKRKDGASRSIKLAERFSLLFIIEQLYPRYWRICRKGYGVIYHRQAKKFLRKNSLRYAVIYALRSLIRGSLFKENTDLIIETIKIKLFGQRSVY